MCVRVSCFGVKVSCFRDEATGSQTSYVRTFCVSVQGAYFSLSLSARLLVDDVPIELSLRRFQSIYLWMTYP